MAVQTPEKPAKLAAPALIPLGHHQGKPPIPLAKNVILVGSRKTAHLHLLSRHVSRAHALILSEMGNVYIRDLASREKIYVNGREVREAWLKDGDLLKVGSFTFKYKDGTTPKKKLNDRPPHDAALDVVGADAPLAISEKVMLIGRRPTSDVSLIEASVSTAHAVIFHLAGRRYLRDLGSRTGTFINEKRVHQQELNLGDVIRIGETEMRYVQAGEHVVKPVAAEPAAAEIDELEHLVGTAPLDMAAEMQRAAVSHMPEPRPQPRPVPTEEHHEEVRAREPDAAEAPLDELDLLAPTVAGAVEPPPLDLLSLDHSHTQDASDAGQTQAAGFELEHRVPPPEDLLEAPAASGDQDSEFLPQGEHLIPIGSPHAPVEEAVSQPAEELAAAWPEGLLPVDGEGEPESPVIDADAEAVEDSSDGRAGANLAIPLDLAGQEAITPPEAELATAGPEFTGAEIPTVQDAALEVVEDAPLEEIPAEELLAVVEGAIERLDPVPAHDDAVAWADEEGAVETVEAEGAAAAELPVPSPDALPDYEPAAAVTSEGGVEELPTLDVSPVKSESAPVVPEVFEQATDDMLPLETVSEVAELEPAASQHPIEAFSAEPMESHSSPESQAALEAPAETSVGDQGIAPLEFETPLSGEGEALSEDDLLEALSMPVAGDQSAAEVSEIPLDEAAPVLDGNALPAEINPVEAEAVETPPVEGFWGADAAAEIVEETALLPEQPVIDDQSWATAAPEQAADIAPLSESEVAALEAQRLHEPMAREPEPLPLEPEAQEEIPAAQTLDLPEPAAEIEQPLDQVEEISTLHVEAPMSDTSPLAPLDASLAVEGAAAGYSTLDGLDELLNELLPPDELQQEPAGEAVMGPEAVDGALDVSPFEAAVTPEAELAQPQSGPIEHSELQTPAQDAWRPSLESEGAGEVSDPGAAQAAELTAFYQADVVEAPQDVTVTASVAEVADAGAPAESDELVAELPPTLPVESEEAQAPALEAQDVAAEAVEGFVEPALELPPVTESAEEFEPTAEQSIESPITGGQDGSGDRGLEALPPLELSATGEEVAAEPVDTVSEFGMAPEALLPESAAMPQEQVEALEDVEILEEDMDLLPPVPVEPENDTAEAGAGALSADEFAASEALADDAHALAGEDLLPLLELDAAELAPVKNERDPDALLPLDQVNPEELEEVEILDAAEPTNESALLLDAVVPPELTQAPQEQEQALSDTAFGQQVQEFSGDGGDLVEEFPAPHEPVQENPPIAAGPLLPESSHAESGAAAEPHEAPHEEPLVGADAVAPMSLVTDFFWNAGTTADETGGGAPSADGTTQLDGPQRIEETVAPAEGDVSQTAGAAIVPADSIETSDFGISTDLASYIGGMPLHLPDVPPAPPSFGKVEVTFGHGDAPWERTRPIAGLADEMKLAAEGLRDVERMDGDDEEAQAGPLAGDSIFEEALELGDGAPADEWNLDEVMVEEPAGDLSSQAGREPPADGAIVAPLANEPASGGEDRPVLLEAIPEPAGMRQDEVIEVVSPVEVIEPAEDEHFDVEPEPVEEGAPMAATFDAGILQPPGEEALDETAWSDVGAAEGEALESLPLEAVELAPVEIDSAPGEVAEIAAPAEPVEPEAPTGPPWEVEHSDLEDLAAVEMPAINAPADVGGPALEEITPEILTDGGGAHELSPADAINTPAETLQEITPLEMAGGELAEEEAGQADAAAVQAEASLPQGELPTAPEEISGDDQPLDEDALLMEVLNSAAPADAAGAPAAPLELPEWAMGQASAEEVATEPLSDHHEETRATGVDGEPNGELSEAGLMDEPLAIAPSGEAPLEGPADGAVTGEHEIDEVWPVEGGNLEHVETEPQELNQLARPDDGAAQEQVETLDISAVEAGPAASPLESFADEQPAPPDVAMHEEQGAAESAGIEEDLTPHPHAEPEQGEAAEAETSHWTAETEQVETPHEGISLTPELPASEAHVDAATADEVVEVFDDVEIEEIEEPAPPREDGVARSLTGIAGSELPSRLGEPLPAPTGDAIFGSALPGKDAASPFAGMQQLPQVDVFSGLAASGTEDSFGSLAGTGAVQADASSKQDMALEPPSAETDEEAKPRRQRRARTRPPRLGVLGAGVAAVETQEPAQEAEIISPQPAPVYRTIRARRNIGRRILALLIVMLLLAGGSVALIMRFFNVRVTHEGTLRFNNMAALTRQQRETFKAEQRNKLFSQQVQLGARGYLAAQQISAGFLSVPEELGRLEPDWRDSAPDTMRLAYTGGDLQDARRLYAVLLSMYQENSREMDRQIRLKSEIAALERRLKELTDLRTRRDEIKKIVDAAPGADEVRKLEDQAREAEIQYDVAAAAVKDAMLELKRIQEQVPAPATPSSKPAAGKGAAPQNDPELVSLQRALDEASSRLAAAKSAASEEADSRRKELDQAVELFQQTASGMAKDSPELAQYVQAVQQLQERTHKLSGDLIEVQQQQHKRLSALKKDMDEQVQSRKNELWGADAKLAELRSQLDLAQRKYNAATDPQSGLAADSREVKDALAEVKDLTTQIEARKAELGNDPIVARVADGIQELIKVNKERLDADRQRIEQDIKAQEQSFAQGQLVEKLPEAQRTAAAALKAKQDQINQLRRQYAAALEKKNAESNAAVRDLEATVSGLSSRLEEKKRILVAETTRKLSQDQEAARKKALEQKQAALRSAEEQAANARKLYLERNKALTSAQAKRDEVAAQRQVLESLDAKLAIDEAQGKIEQLTLEERKEQLAKLVWPVKPTDADVVEIARDNPRPLYIAITVGALAVIFGILAVFMAMGSDRELVSEESLVDGGIEEIIPGRGRRSL